MSNYTKSLEELRDNLAEATVRVLSDAAKESRTVLTVDERKKLDDLEEARKDVEARLKRAVEDEQRAKDIDASFRRDNPGDQEQRQDDGSFGKWVREARAGESYDMPIESRAMSATGGVGKAGVHTQLWEYAIEASEILGYATLMTTSDGNTIPMPRATVHSEADAADIAANGAIVEDDSTLDTVDLGVAKRGYKTAVPNELIQDATFDVEGYIARNAGRQLGNVVAAAAVTAAIAGFTTVGVTTPGGVLNNLGSQSTAGQGSDLLVDLFHSVIAPYRASAKAAFGMSDSSAAVVRKLKTTDGVPVWQPALIAGNPDTILGKPVFIAPGFDGFGASKKPLFFGDWAALVVRIAGGLRFERSAEAGFGNDQTVFRALVRRGAVTLDPNAVKPLATPAV